MPKNKSAQNSLIIAAVAIMLTSAFLTFNFLRTRENQEKFNAALGTKRSGKVVEIQEKMFATQVNDVYLNTRDYLGKTIKLEGIFKCEQDNEKSYCYVVRYGFGGCCGTDANIGFGVAWAQEKAESYPSAESWVEAIGVLKIDKAAGNSLYLDLSSLSVLSRRGAEIVFQ
jgi:uncharacterized membrane protein YcgQ (UPF0703/DUF1980 family)